METVNHMAQAAEFEARRAADERNGRFVAGIELLESKIPGLPEDSWIARAHRETIEVLRSFIA